MQEVQNPQHPRHTLQLQDRACLTIGGITDIDRFDEREIVVFTQLGELTVTGRDLHIRTISIENGDITVEGDIWGLLYGDKDRQSPATFLGRLFR